MENKVEEEWILKRISVKGKLIYSLLHMCKHRNYSSTVEILNEENKVVGRVCFSCAKEAPSYKVLLVELSK